MVFGKNSQKIEGCEDFMYMFNDIMVNLSIFHFEAVAITHFV